jgi:hypothetical protein
VKPDGTPINGQPPSLIISSSEVGQAGTLTISGIGPEPSDAAQQVTLNNVHLNTVVKDGPANLVPAAIAIRGDTVHLTNGTVIETDTSGSAHAGNITIRANNMSMDQGTTISSRTFGSGAGGNISIDATRAVSMSGGSTISGQSAGAGNAGNIAINAGAQFLGQSASITTEATRASGGNILIQATDSIRLVNSQLSTSVQGGANTSGGNITLDPAIVTLQNSQVLAQAVQGAGGNINIIAGTYLSDPTRRQRLFSIRIERLRGHSVTSVHSEQHLGRAAATPAATTAAPHSALCRPGKRTLEQPRDRRAGHAADRTGRMADEPSGFHGYRGPCPSVPGGVRIFIWAKPTSEIGRTTVSTRCL